jgi:hypothetical protein
VVKFLILMDVCKKRGPGIIFVTVESIFYRIKLTNNRLSPSAFPAW